MRRFLLKRVQDVDGIRKTHGVDRPVRVPIMIFHDLKNPWPLAFPGLR